MSEEARLLNRLSAAPEAVTGADGRATIRFRIRASFKPTSGELVVVILRAREPGGSILADVSTRRLVSVPVA